MATLAKRALAQDSDPESLHNRRKRSKLSETHGHQVEGAESSGGNEATGEAWGGHGDRAQRRAARLPLAKKTGEAEDRDGEGAAAEQNGGRSVRALVG